MRYTIDICGVKYKVITHKKLNKIMKDNNFNAYCDVLNKSIHLLEIRNIAGIFGHELAHCYLYENGYYELFDDEEFVEDLSKQLGFTIQHMIDLKSRINFPEYLKTHKA